MFKMNKLKLALPILLKDRTTEKNIIFACDQYENIDFYTEIDIEHLRNSIKPRYLKDKQQKEKRQKKNAEVFTPAWLCNKMNNLIDSAWFGYDDVFNTEKEKSWVSKTEKIEFPETKSWKDYILSRRMEITCGEAPYLTSRYDSVSGEPISIENRIGLFDRKLRVISENISKEEDWIYFAQQALQNIYGFEYQGATLTS